MSRTRLLNFLQALQSFLLNAIDVHFDASLVAQKKPEKRYPHGDFALTHNIPIFVHFSKASYCDHAKLDNLIQTKIGGHLVYNFISESHERGFNPPNFPLLKRFDVYLAAMSIAYAQHGIFKIVSSHLFLFPLFSPDRCLRGPISEMPALVSQLVLFSREKSRAKRAPKSLIPF